MLLTDLNPIERLKTLPLLFPEVGQGAPATLSPLSSTELKNQELLKADLSQVEEYVEIVTILYAIDRVFSEIIGYQNGIYILGDTSIGSILNKQFLNSEKYTSSEVSSRLEVLAIIGLIYRFNVARKFGYPERGVMQLRLNSWGKHFFISHQLDKSPYFDKLFSSLANEITQHKEKYEQLISLCNSAARPLRVQEIHSFNSTLPLTVVT